ncbi:hypothetical protein L195_g060580 [Trifolium pratense]|uniref:Uncharacterized protein n=1 Tax=Trifolium pratense TaxID=57577 RepID=A0A2K3K4N9_TRIPR|nr:hypothetical protein L195_g060580 [Trifolium pratense]
MPLVCVCVEVKEGLSCNPLSIVWSIVTVLETNVVPDVYTFVAPDTGVGKNDQDKPNQIDTTEQERIPVVVFVC